MTTKFIVLLFIHVFAFSQTAENEDKTKSYIDVKITNSTELGYEINFEKAQKKLKKAKTDKEKYIAYFEMGDAKYKMMKYFDALKYFQKADYFAQQGNLGQEIFIVNVFLSNTYSVIGIPSKAQAHLYIAEKTSGKLNDPENEYMLNSIKSANLEREDKFCEASKYIALLYYYNKKESRRTKKEDVKYDYLASSNYLTYLYIKCRNLRSAKDLIEEYEAAYHPKTDSIRHYLLEMYYLDKALISIQENKKEEARIWFDEAIKRAKLLHNKGTLKIIIQERLLYNIGDSSSEQKYFKEYLELHNQAVKESALAYNGEYKNQEKTSEQQKINVKALIVISIILVLAILFTLYYTSKRKKQLKSRFEAIIKDLEKHDSVIAKEVSEKEESTENEKTAIKQKVISESKEAELLQKLEEFENGTEFTSKNFTIANLSSILDTNSKYTNYILKEHRGKNFNEYINGLKINFIVRKLYNQPEMLNYKINYLSDLAGFSSHSRFASNFRKELNMSPSEFITQLSRKN